MFIFILLSLLILAILSYKRIEWGLYLILFLLPTYLIRFKIGPIPFTFLEGMILILTAVWLIKKLQKRELIKSLQATSYKLQATKWSILVLVAAATISIFISPNRLSALGDWRAFFIEPLILLIIFLDLISTKTDSQLLNDRSKVENIIDMNSRKIKNVFYALGGSAIYVSLFIFYQIFTGYLVPLNYLKEGRMTSFYGYPAAVGLYLAPILALFIGMAIKKFKIKTAGSHPERRPRETAAEVEGSHKPWNSSADMHRPQNDISIFSIIVIIFSSVALLATKTEGAYLGVIAATFIILMFTQWRKWVLIGSAILLVVVMVIPISRSYIIQKATFSDVSGNVRLVLWQGTLRALKAHPIFGGGLSGFPNLYQKYKEDRHVELLKYPHNVILNLWSETGILGLFAFLWLIFEFFRKTFSDYNLKPKTYNLAIIAAMLSLLIYGLLDVPYFKNDLSILFWILIGLSVI